MKPENESIDNPQDDNEEAKAFVVKDKRYWAEGDEDGSSPSNGKERKPKYVEELEERLQSAESKVAEIRNAHTESAAEFEKAKERLRRNTTEEVERARLQVAASLFELTDNLDRVIEGTRSGGSVESIIEGVSMIRGQFFQALTNFGVTQFTPIGETFDPTQHEAVAMVPVTDPEQNKKVVEVHQPGFRAGDNILRPATVLVGQGPRPDTESSSEPPASE